jgi:hypothetical protein
MIAWMQVNRVGWTPLTRTLQREHAFSQRSAILPENGRESDLLNEQ